MAALCLLLAEYGTGGCENELMVAGCPHMSVYVIGDVQGCRGALERLLETLEFSEASDRIWFLGDLVNRGPDSLGALRWAANHGANSVLGNHDLHLLRLAAGVPGSGDDGLQEIIDAPDGPELIHWLRHRPLLAEEGRFVLVHAGFLPWWDLSDIHRLTALIEAELRAPDWRDRVRLLTERVQWTPERATERPLAFALAALTRIRTVDGSGWPDFRFKGPPESAPPRLTPWYAHSRIPHDGHTILFGHWASLGHRRLEGAIALDGGCVWGGALVAYRLEDGTVFLAQAEMENREP